MRKTTTKMHEKMNGYNGKWEGAKAQCHLLDSFLALELTFQAEIRKKIRINTFSSQKCSSQFGHNYSPAIGIDRVRHWPFANLFAIFPFLEQFAGSEQ